MAEGSAEVLLTRDPDPPPLVSLQPMQTRRTFLAAAAGIWEIVGPAPHDGRARRRSRARSRALSLLGRLLRELTELPSVL